MSHLCKENEQTVHGCTYGSSRQIEKEVRRVRHSQKLVSIVCVIIAFLSVGPSLFAATATAPTTYSAYSGTDAKPIPHAPALGPANSIIHDPTFGSRILRVTDAHTNGGNSLIPEYAGFFRTWNADSTALKLHGPHGTSYWLEFHASSFKVGDGSARPTLHPLSFNVKWEWSAVDPDIIYFYKREPTGEIQQDHACGHLPRPASERSARLSCPGCRQRRLDLFGGRIRHPKYLYTDLLSESP